MSKGSLNVCVLASDNYLWALRPFSFLFNTFWDDHEIVRIFGFRKPDFRLPVNFHFISIKEDQYNHNRWANGLLDMVKILKDQHIRHFILMLEDYWLYEFADSKKIGHLVRYMQSNPDVLRMDLSNERNSKRHVKEIDHYANMDIIEAPPRTSYMMSFQAGIWNINLMQQVIFPDESPWDAEIDGTKRLWDQPSMRVLGTRQWLLKYTPAVRRHKEGINLDRIPNSLTHVMKKRGWLDDHHVPIQRRSNM